MAFERGLVYHCGGFVIGDILVQQSYDRRTAPLSGDAVALASLAAAALLTLAYAAMGCFTKPAMYSDAAFGFLVWDSLPYSHAFNVAVGPDPANIAVDTGGFSTWWAPGQYVFPGLLERLGLDLGIAMVTVATACSAIGLWGWFGLCRAMGFSIRTAALTVAITAGTRHFALPFGIYNGGEVLMFAATPWFLRLVWTLRDLRWTAVLPLSVATLGLIFLKLSGLVLSGAAISAAVLSGGPPWFNRETMRKAIVAAATLGATAAAFYFAWFTRGGNPMSAATGFHPALLPGHAAFIVSGMWSGMFSFGDLANFVFFHPSRPILSSHNAVFYLMSVPALGTLAVLVRRLRASHAKYLRFVLLAAAATAAFFLLTWLRGGLVSLEERHFAAISMLFLIGVVEAFAGAGLILRVVFAGVASLAMVYGIASAVGHARINLADPLGTRGYRLHNASLPLLDHLHKIDVADADGTRPVIYVPTPEMGVELRHARLIASHADFDGIEQLRKHIYRGRVRRLYVVAQAPLVANGKAEAILGSFADYPRDAWKMTSLGSFVVYSAIE